MLLSVFPFHLNMSRVIISLLPRNQWYHRYIGQNKPDGNLGAYEVKQKPHPLYTLYISLK